MNIFLSKVLNLNFIIVLFILLYNLYIRYITIRIFTEYEKIFIIFLFIFIIIISFYVSYVKTVISFVFGATFFLFGFRPYDIQSQIFETLVLLVTLFYFIDNFLNNNSKKLNNNLRNLFILFIILSLGSLLLLPVKYILYNFLNLGNEWYLYQIVNAVPNSFYYPLNGINRLILYFTFSVIISLNSVKTFLSLFLGLFFGGMFCSILGIMDFYGLISLSWYSQAIMHNVLSSTFMNRGWYAEYIVMITPFILILFIYLKSSILKVFLFGMLIILELTLILAGARAGWVSYPLVLLFCWIFLYFVNEGKLELSHTKWKSLIKVVLSVPLTIIVSVVIVFYVIVPLTELSTGLETEKTGVYSQQSNDDILFQDHMQERATKIFESSSRTKVWMQGIDAGMESPIFGIGHDSFAWHTSILSGIPESRYSVNLYNKFLHLHETPHNLYIHLFVNVGYVGLTIWGIFILYCILLLFYDLIKNNNLINIPILIAIVIFHIYGIFQSMQYLPMIWFFIFICIAFSLRISNDVLPMWLESMFKNTNKFVLFLVIVGIVTYIYNSESEHLAKKYQLAKYEYNQRYNQYMGFYPVENWNGENYRWTGRNSKIKLNRKGKIKFKMQFHNVRPDLKPVKVKISVDGEFHETVTFKGKSNVISKDIILDLGDSVEEKILSFSISRTWSPKNYGSNDRRVLGVAISEIKSVNI